MDAAGILQTKNPKNKFKSKGAFDRKRFQLFDPKSKSDLVDLCEGGVIHLHLENEDADEKDNSTSLDFEGSGSDDEIENLPVDTESASSNKNDISASPKDKLKNGKIFCGSCSVKFVDSADQRLHYTLDWHRYNVKRKLNGQSFVSEANFYEMMDDLSSIDGSDDEQEDPTPTGQVDRLLEKLNTSPSKETISGQKIIHLNRSQKLENSPKTFFQNARGQVISCYKSIVNTDKILSSLDDKDNASRRFSKFKDTPLRITIIMSSGGHFAAAMFDGNNCTNHKTFHSYTVRAKQGGSQSSCDSKSGTSHTKSAGSSLRRYNEQSFIQHVQDLLVSWKKGLAESHLIFYRAVSPSAKNSLFGGKSPPLSKENQKLRTIPFPTKRPTFSEIKRVHSFLTTVHIYEEEFLYNLYSHFKESLESFLSSHTHFVKKADKPTKGKKVFNRAKSRSPKRKEDLEIIDTFKKDSSDTSDNEGSLHEVTEIVDFSELKEFDDSLAKRSGQRKRNKKPKAFKVEGPLNELAEVLVKEGVAKFQTLLNELVKQSENSINFNEVIDEQSLTLLHVAAKQNLNDIVWTLLEAGSDPAVKDKFGKYPYNYAESKECRDTFRRFMGQFPDKFDYKKAQVPPPLSEEMEKERAEKRKLLNKLKREKEKQKKVERMEKDKETEEQKRFLNLTDREKRALAAEQRILAQCKRNSEKPPVMVRCFECAKDITGKVPFEYNQNVFCTTNCVAVHRKKFPCPPSV